MKAIHKLEVRINNLEQIIKQQADDLWKLKNPPKYKIGDQVYIQKGTGNTILVSIVDIRFANNKEYVFDKSYQQRGWEYCIATKKGIDWWDELELISTKI